MLDLTRQECRHRGHATAQQLLMRGRIDRWTHASGLDVWLLLFSIFEAITNAIERFDPVKCFINVAKFLA